MRAYAEIDSRLASHFLHEIARRGGKPPLRRMMVVADRSVKRNFQDEGRPRPWAPLAESTKRSRNRQSMKTQRGRKQLKKSGGSYSILQNKGQLKKSIKAVALGTSNFMVFTNLRSRTGAPYPVFLQYGTVYMPPREFLVWQDEDIKEFNRILINHVIGMRG